MCARHSPPVRLGWHRCALGVPRSSRRQVCRCPVVSCTPRPLQHCKLWATPVPYPCPRGLLCPQHIPPALWASAPLLRAMTLPAGAARRGGEAAPRRGEQGVGGL